MLCIYVSSTLSAQCLLLQLKDCNTYACSDTLPERLRLYLTDSICAPHLCIQGVLYSFFMHCICISNGSIDDCNAIMIVSFGYSTLACSIYLFSVYVCEYSLLNGFTVTASRFHRVLGICNVRRHSGEDLCGNGGPNGVA